jgi:hypothetical protein
MVSREGQFHLQASVADAFRRSEEALIAIGGRISVRDQATGYLTAKTPWSIRSWGDNIKVVIAGADDDVDVHFRSDSRLPTTLIDWGKSADNMKRFGDWLTKTQRG